jgi:hypothetical protein
LQELYTVEVVEGMKEIRRMKGALDGVRLFHVA